MADFTQAGGTEMSEDYLRAHYGGLVDEALLAFRVDSRYATEIALKAQAILSRRIKRDQRLSS